jgi:hypothetical protein
LSPTIHFEDKINSGKTAGQLLLWYSNPRCCGCIEKHATKLLDLVRGLGFYLLTDKSEPHHKIHEGRKCRTAFQESWGMNEIVVDHSPNERDWLTICSNRDASMTKSGVVLDSIHFGSPSVFKDRTMEQ